MKPLIQRSDLTGRYYLLTRYRIVGDSVIASTKYDVTDEIVAILEAAQRKENIDADPQDPRDSRDSGRGLRGRRRSDRPALVGPTGSGGLPPPDPNFIDCGIDGCEFAVERGEGRTMALHKSEDHP